MQKMTGRERLLRTFRQQETDRMSKKNNQHTVMKWHHRPEVYFVL